jgi:sulfite reductase (ferredoxin)
VHAGFVNGAKAILLLKTKTNHHAGIINLFDVVFVESNKITLDSTLKIWYQINQNEPSEAFKKYMRGNCFFQNIETYRAKDIADENSKTQ